ncbi:efflux RND transporter periplasmic adaptor subunit [Arenimonas composti]|uniref:Uncharacterized protein n=1 Tax=Arenimonas composti TR7-09 = DSM 18010 TaxID=1121013 RepID=A0A091BG38_9GAMM|nr:efflux RND transporter periplasmic adaptor subunit [Arenimonas composti]KFN50467.1 hypothetical protein P873_07330 [Arenimonas composti TR7-09 = DSM 18010]
MNAFRLPRLARAATFALTLAVATACSLQAQESGTIAPAQVTVAAVVERDVARADEFTGRIAAVESVAVRARVGGYIDRIAFREGQEVRRGDVLFVIDDREYRAALARAEAELAGARSRAAQAGSELARARQLAETRLISAEQLEQRRAVAAQTEADVRAAQAQVEVARLDLEFTRVRAPIDGLAGRAEVTAGNLAAADATVLTTIVSLDPVHVYFEGDEQTWLRYDREARDGGRARADGNPVRVGLAGEEGWPHAGRLDFVDNRVDPGTGTIRARAVLANPDRVFRPGLFARVQLLADSPQPALLVDDKAVLTDQDRKYVYVVGANDTAERRDVVPGRLIDGLRMIESGLQPGDRVVVGGVQRIFFPGMPLAPVEAEGGAAPAAVAAR